MTSSRRGGRDDRLATMVRCFLAEGSGAGLGLLGALPSVLAEPPALAASTGPDVVTVVADLDRAAPTEPA